MSTSPSKRKRTLPTWMKKTDVSVSANIDKDKDCNQSSRRIPSKKNGDGSSSPVPVKQVVKDDLSDEGESYSGHLGTPTSKMEVERDADISLNEVKRVLRDDLSDKDLSGSVHSNSPYDNAEDESKVTVSLKEMQEAAAKSPNHDGPSGSGSSAVSSPTRQSCYYGSSCYRKNPQHRIDFAHPGDVDYQNSSDTPSGNSKDASTDNRPLCQYGEACYRKNPQHRLDFRHDTPAKRQARPTELLDISSDNDGDFNGSFSSDNYNPNGSESDDSFVTSDSMASGDSDFDPEDEEKENASKKRKKTQRKDKKKKAKKTPS